MESSQCQRKHLMLLTLTYVTWHKTIYEVERKVFNNLRDNDCFHIQIIFDITSRVHIPSLSK